MNINADAKRALRAKARRIRACLDADARANAARRLAEIGLSFLSLPAGATVAAYHPLKDELDPLPLLARLRAQGLVTALPSHAPGSPHLTFHRWQPGDPLERGDFGVLMPSLLAPRAEPDVVLAPLLAFDAAGHRLGYGAGYYDRSLQRLRADRPVIAVGLAFDEQEAPELPQEPLDQRLDWILTPSGPRKCGPA